jgi:20S proteasome, alpha and beta subunits
MIFCRTVIGLRGKDGVVFAVEKLVTSKLYEPGANRRIFSIDKYTGMVSVLGIMNNNVHHILFLEFCLWQMSVYFY